MGRKKISITDCRESEGITVGLIDSLISIARVLRPRLKMHHEQFEERYRLDVDNNYHLASEIEEALKDLHQDEDLLFILQYGPFNPRIMNDEDIKIREALSKAAQLLKDRNTIIEV